LVNFKVTLRMAAELAAKDHPNHAGERQPIGQVGGRGPSCGGRRLDAFNPASKRFIATHLQKRLTDATHSR
jgi:hypothetical protein